MDRSTEKVTSINERVTFWQDFAKSVHDGEIEEAVVVYINKDQEACFATLGEEPDIPMLFYVMSKVMDIMKDVYDDDEE